MSERITDERLAGLVSYYDALGDAGYSELLSALRELASLREQTRWIPVTERLPEVNKLVCVKYALHPLDTISAEWGCMWFDGNCWQERDWSCELKDSTHWREIGPLPGGDA